MPSPEEFNLLIDKYKKEMEKYLNKPQKKTFPYSGNEPSCGSEDVTVRDAVINTAPPAVMANSAVIVTPNVYQTNSVFPLRENEPWETSTAQIKVFASAGREGIPVSDANVTISRTFEGNDVLAFFTKTNISGETELITVPAPPKENSQIRGSEHPFSNYNIRVDAQGYYTVENINVPVFGGQISIQPVEMIPIPENERTIPRKLVYESEPADLQGGN